MVCFKKKLIIAHIHSGDNNGVCTGHYMPVAEMYFNLFSSSCPICIAGGQLYSKRFPHYEILNLPYSIKLQASSLVTILQMFCNARRMFKNTRDQIVVLQDGKPLATYLCVLFFYKECKLYLIKYTADINNKLNRIIFNLIKHRIKGIICPNDAIGQAHGLPYCVVPDYIYAGNSISNNWTNYSDRKYDFCCLGRIEPEKGVVEVAEKFKNTKYKLLIAGNPNPQELACKLKTICQDAPNIELRLGYLDDNDYETALNNSKYAILNYQGVYANRSSGVVFDMLFHGVPVIGCNCGALNFVSDNQVGCLYNDLSDFSPCEVMSKELHAEYLNKIEEYCNKHIEFKKKLATFLGI